MADSVPVFMGLARDVPKRVLALAVGEKVRSGEHEWERLDETHLQVRLVARPDRVETVPRTHRDIAQTIAIRNQTNLDAFDPDEFGVAMDRD